MKAVWAQALRSVIRKTFDVMMRSPATHGEWRFKPAHFVSRHRTARAVPLEMRTGRLAPFRLKLRHANASGTGASPPVPYSGPPPLSRYLFSPRFQLLTKDLGVVPDVGGQLLRVHQEAIDLQTGKRRLD